MKVISVSDKVSGFHFFPLVSFCVTSILFYLNEFLSLGMGWDPATVVMTLGAPGF